MKAFVLTVFAIAAVSSPGLAEGPLVWGEVSGGVRLGIGLGPTTPQPTLRLVFREYRPRRMSSYCWGK